MFEFILIFAVITISFIGISIGSILKNKPITGSCGGLANIENGETCEICGRNTIEGCENQN
jgi:hypothetical protein